MIGPSILHLHLQLFLALTIYSNTSPLPPSLHYNPTPTIPAQSLRILLLVIKARRYLSRAIRNYTTPPVSPPLPPLSLITTPGKEENLLGYVCGTISLSAMPNLRFNGILARNTTGPAAPSMTDQNRAGLVCEA